MPGPFNREDIREFLADYGYTSNPVGLAEPFPVDYVSETKGVAYLDINADAVRKGNEVPDRPVRITFHKIFDGTFTRWKLKSVQELAPGVETKCLDRQPETPKISPWPHQKTKKNELRLWACATDFLWQTAPKTGQMGPTLASAFLESP